jgi:TP901 family phage tail tape measure protein
VAKSIANLAIKLALDATAMSGGVSSAKSSMNNLSTSVSGAMGSMASSIIDAGMAVAGLVKDFLGLQTGMAAVQVGIDFERQMSIVKAVTQSTADDFHELREEARKIGRDTEFTASQAAQAMQNLSRSGLGVDAILASSKAVVNLASVLSVDIPQAAQLAADVLQGFQLNASELGGIVDVLAKAAVSGAGSADDLSDAFKFVASSASIAGKSVDETTAALIVLGRRGLRGSEAGTALSRMMMKMSKITPQAQTALEELGITFEDKEGNFKHFGDIVEELHAKLGKFGRVEALEIIGKVFDVRAGRAAAMLAFLKEGGKEIRAMEASVKQAKKDGLAGGVAAEQIKNVWGAIKIVQSSWEGLMESIFASVQGPLKQAIDTFTRYINQIRDVVGKTAETVSQTLQQIGVTTKKAIGDAGGGDHKNTAEMLAEAAGKPKINNASKLNEGIFEGFRKISNTSMKKFMEVLQKVVDFITPFVNKLAIFNERGMAIAQTFNVLVAVGKLWLNGLIGIAKFAARISVLVLGMSVDFANAFTDDAIASGRDAFIEGLIWLEFQLENMGLVFDLWSATWAANVSAFMDSLNALKTDAGPIAAWLGKVFVSLGNVIAESFTGAMSALQENFKNFSNAFTEWAKDPTKGFNFSVTGFEIKGTVDTSGKPDVLGNVKPSQATIDAQKKVLALAEQRDKKFDDFRKKRLDELKAGDPRWLMDAFSEGFKSLFSGDGPLGGPGEKGDGEKGDGGQASTQLSGAALLGSKEAVQAELRFAQENRVTFPEMQLKEQQKANKILEEIKQQLKFPPKVDFNLPNKIPG